MSDGRENSYQLDRGPTFETNHQMKGDYLGSVHILRGIAAMLVVFDHVMGRPPFSRFNHWFGFLDGLGGYGVVAFFCISGLVLFFAMAKGYQIRKFPRFMLRRIIRIGPTYFVSILFAVVLVFLMSYAAPNSAAILPSWSQLFQNIFYLIPLTGESWIQPVYWTLAVEFQFYFTIGIFFPLVATVAKKHIYGAMTLIVSFSLLTFLDLLFPAAKLFKYSPFFAIGMLCAAGIVHRPVRWAMLVGTTVCMAVGLAGGLDVASIVVGGGVAVMFLLSPGSVDKESPWVRPFWYLGTISYSLFVVHQAIASAGENAGRLLLRAYPGAEGGIILNLIPLATMLFCILVAHCMHRLVELPSMRLSKRIRP